MWSVRFEPDRRHGDVVAFAAPATADAGAYLQVLQDRYTSLTPAVAIEGRAVCNAISNGMHSTDAVGMVQNHLGCLCPRPAILSAQPWSTSAAELVHVKACPAKGFSGPSVGHHRSNSESSSACGWGGGVDTGEHFAQMLEFGEFDAEALDHRRGTFSACRRRLRPFGVSSTWVVRSSVALRDRVSRPWACSRLSIGERVAESICNNPRDVLDRQRLARWLSRCPTAPASPDIADGSARAAPATAGTPRAPRGW